MRRFALLASVAAIGAGLTTVAPVAVAAVPSASSARVPACKGCVVGPELLVYHPSVNPIVDFVSGAETLTFPATTIGTHSFYTDLAIGADDWNDAHTVQYDNLTIYSIDMPAGFTLVYGPNVSSSQELAGTSHATKIQCDATSEGTITGDMVIHNNSANEGNFVVHLSCTVSAQENGGVGAGLPDNGSESQTMALLAGCLVVFGGSVRLLARRRA